MNRVEKLLSATDRSARVLEIGPSYNPVAPKKDGWNSFSIDHATQAELREKYAGLGDLCANIEAVDFIWRGGPIHDAIPADMHHSFDYFIASHVIEHIPNPIALFHSLDRLLSPNAAAAFAVPDKRFCFDFFRPLTLTPAWIEAFERNATRHSRRAIMENRAYYSHNRDLMAWGQEPDQTKPVLKGDVNSAKLTSDAAGLSEDQPYVDCHAWCFTPSSFELLFVELAALGLIDFHIAQMFATDGCEFTAILRKGSKALSAEATQARRLELLKAMITEQVEQFDRMRPEPVIRTEAKPWRILPFLRRRA